MSPPCGRMFALPQLTDIAVVTVEAMTRTVADPSDRAPGPLGHVTLRGDRATASLKSICPFRILGFVFCGMLFKGSPDSAR